MKAKSKQGLPREVSVRVPASTSNCGAGFDTLGLALRLYNTVVVRRCAAGKGVLHAPPARLGAAMAADAARIFFARSGVAPFDFQFAISGDVPVSRGLGSSVTLGAGIVAGLNELSGARLAKLALAAILTKFEGHPDNATAGVLGGFCVGRTDPQTGELLGVVRQPIGREVSFVVVSPAQELETKQARGILPRKLPYFDAVRSVNSSSYVVAAFLTGEFDRLAHAVADFMHEPYRLPNIPGAGEAIKAGVQAGAYTGWLSGSGSSVLCVATPAKAAAVGRAMAEAFFAVGVASQIFPLRADNTGLKIISRKP
ncbi:MAG: homoserine kinase [Candidatus Didemnitutus sp.]|nr:homoserine kinase [Candidatus Didemnitutus sp.]